jgi:hypothetical protein
VGASLSIQRRRIDAAIHEAAGLPYPVPLEIQRAIKHADRVLLKTEKRDLMRPSSLRWSVDDEEGAPMADAIVPRSIEAAENMFRGACEWWLPACRSPAVRALKGGL